MGIMTWDQIRNDWAGLQKRHRMEIARAVATYCAGHKMEEVAKELGFTMEWVRQQLDHAGVSIAVEGGFGKDTLQNQIAKVVRKFGPDVKVKLEGQGGNQSISSIEGDDAEEFEPYLDQYLNDGHEPAAATRLAKAEWAAEEALEAGIFKESTNKRKERIVRVLSPDGETVKYLIDLNVNAARMNIFCTWLDASKIEDLKRPQTRTIIAKVHDKWREQVDRLRNFHPTFDEEVENNGS